MKTSLIKFAVRLVFFLFCVSAVFSESGDIKQNIPVTPMPPKWEPLFPSALWVKNAPIQQEVLIYTVKTKEEMEASLKFDESKLQSVLLNNDIFALYGKPGAYTMGILGRYSPEEIEPIMNEFTATYDEVNNERGLIPAFYLIYGTCWPGGDIGLLRQSTVKKYIEFAAERGWYVFIDHQIGKYTVEQAMNAILPFLKYPNVHLALDPEWHTTEPMKVIGSVTGEEINKAQAMMDKYIKENNITGRRMLVIHQFNSIMIQNRQAVRTNFERVQLIHCSDGFGPPGVKRDTYYFNAVAKNMPIKSFKLFLPTKVVGAGYDQPLMSPKDVMNLKPRPYFIMYQ